MELSIEKCKISFIEGVQQKFLRFPAFSNFVCLLVIDNCNYELLMLLISYRLQIEERYVTLLLLIINFHKPSKNISRNNILRVNNVRSRYGSSHPFFPTYSLNYVSCYADRLDPFSWNRVEAYLT